MHAHERAQTHALKHARKGALRRAAQRGLSLIEIMVGLTLGMLVAAALLTLFANASANGQNIQRAGVQIENGRYISEMLREDLRLAGYWGELVTDGATYSTPDPCATAPSGFTASPLALPTAVRGYPSATTVACLTSRSRLAGTDAIVVRRLDPVPVAPGTIAGTNQQFHLQTSFCNDDASATPLVFDKSSAAFTLRNRACGAANTVRPYISRIYYVASCNVCTGAGDGVPTLKRLDLVGNQLVETALVDGVEHFRLEYGFDTDNNGSADSYLTNAAASGATSLWQNVMAVRVHYVVRSLERVTGSGIARAQTFDLGGAGTVTTANDGFTRRAYSMTVRLINPSGAREVQ